MKIEDVIPRTPLIEYQSPCQYLTLAIQSFGKQFDLDQYATKKEYNRTCQQYEDIRHKYLSLRSVLKEEEYQAIDSLRHMHGRHRRSLGSFFRNMLGIAHMKKQKLMDKVLYDMRDGMFKQEGNIQGLDYLVTMNDKRINKLNNVTATFMENVENALKSVQTTSNNQRIIRQHMLLWIADALTAGSLYNQLLATHVNMLKTRVKAIGDVTRGHLTPEMISPQQMTGTLRTLETNLQKKFNGVSLSKGTIWDYYSSEITSFIQNNTLYISIPVHLEMKNQNFQLYEINSFMIPIENSESPQATIILDYVDLLGINEERNSYFSITHQFLSEHCRGKTILRCNRMITNLDLTTSPTCATAIYQDRLDDVQRLCTIGFMDLKPTTTAVLYELTNSSILVVNPMRTQIYSRCNDYQRKKKVTNEALVTVNINCFCYLFNEQISTPMYVSEDCVDRDTMEIRSQKHTNLIYLASALNKTVSALDELVDFNNSKIPQISIPLHMIHSLVQQQTKEPIYDLKKIMKLQHENYQNSLHSRISLNTQYRSKSEMFRIMVYVIIAIIIMVIIVGIVLTCRVKSLGQMLAISKLLPISQALPLDSVMSQEPVSNMSISIEVLSLLVLILAFTYWVYNHLSLIKRTIKYCAFPVKEFKLENKQPSLTVLLYFTSIKDWCYLHVDEIYALPHEIQIIQSESEVNINYHSGCCTSYITINHRRLGLKIGEGDTNLLIFNQTIAVPAYSKFALQKILNSNYRIQVLVGENKIYRSFEVELKKDIVARM